MIDVAAQPGVLLDIRDLTMRYANGFVALRDVSLTFGAGEFVVILGRNGCGKSTLLRCVARLLDPTQGSIRVGGADLSRLSGQPLRHARCAVAFVTQQPNLVRRRSVLANVASGTLGRHRTLATSLGFLPATELPFAREALEIVGLADRARQRAGTLSGGQAQRVAIGRALAQRPRVLLADEPVASLDPDAAVDVLHLLRRLAHSGLAVVCVLHQPELALRFADRVVGLRGGAVAFDCDVATLPPENITALYAAGAVA